LAHPVYIQTNEFFDSYKLIHNITRWVALHLGTHCNYRLEDSVLTPGE